MNEADKMQTQLDRIEGLLGELLASVKHPEVWPDYTKTERYDRPTTYRPMYDALTMGAGIPSAFKGRVFEPNGAGGFREVTNPGNITT